MKNRNPASILLQMNYNERNTGDKRKYLFQTGRWYLLVMVFVFELFSGCQPAEHERIKKSPSAADLVSVNQYLVKKDQQTITNFVKRKGWEMQTTKTGLWYMIMEHGKGVKTEPGDLVTIAYSIYLLDGTICYSSDSLGLKKFRIGQGNVESGLEEGILLLHAGDKARFIMPPHLSHGLLGDSDKIPSRASIVYEIDLKFVQQTDSKE